MKLKTYSPLPRFPAISLSGSACELHCAHCNATYLDGMLNADTPEKLISICRHLERKGAVGTLLSGGSDHHGRILNLERMLPAIRRIKEETSLILNIHPGLVNDDTIEELAVDFVSLEIPSNTVIQNVFGLPFNKEIYIKTYNRLVASGIPVIPHISVYDGTEHLLLEGIAKPDTVVVIVFSPTKKTEMVDHSSPTPEMVKNVIFSIKKMFPDTEVSLGCMRTRSKEMRYAIEMAALEGGATRIELPSKQTLHDAEILGFTSILYFEACCALPNQLEYKAKSSRHFRK